MGILTWPIRLALLVSAGLALAACGPASQPSQEQTTGQSPSSPSSEVRDTAAKGLASQTTEKTSAAATEQKGPAAVNGIPLDPDAKHGGILRLGGAGTSSPIFLAWENCCILGNPAGMPTTQALVQWRSWGTQQDYENGLFATIQPDLGLTWEQSTDGTSWTFKLPDGATWHDGKPVTCTDVAWTFERNLKVDQGLRTSLKGMHLKAIDAVACPDAQTAVFNLKYPKASLLEVLVFSQFQVYPKHVYENNLDKLRSDPPVGSGPFVATQYIPGEKVTLRKNPTYWNKPLPYLDGIDFQVLAPTAVLAGFRSGRLDQHDSRGMISGSNAETLIKECLDCQVWSRVANPGYGQVIEVNAESKPWGDLRMKEVISLGWNRQKTADIAYQGWGEAARTGMFPPGSGWEMPYDVVKTVPGWNMEDTESNQQKARQLLADLGYKPNELQMTLTVVTWMQQMVPVFVEDMKAIGIQANPMLVDNTKNYEILGAADFTVSLMGYGGNNATKEFGMLEHNTCGSERNYSRYCNPELDRLIRAMETELDPEKQKLIGWQAAEIVMRDNAKIYGTWGTTQAILGPKIRGLIPGPGAFGQGSFQKHETTWLAN